METSQNRQSETQEFREELYTSVQTRALIDTSCALRSINDQYRITPERERGEVSEINQAKKGAELALVSLAIIASDGNEEKTREILSDHGHEHLF